MEYVTIRLVAWGGSPRYAIESSDGEWFYDDRDGVRTYARSSGATAFLRRTGLAWAAKMPSGKTAFINCMDPDEAKRYGPHKEWAKVNAVTLESKQGRFYDLWRCKACGEEVRRYGLTGRPLVSGICKSNPRT